MMIFHEDMISVFRLEVINWFLKTHLSEYSILYQESQEVNIHKIKFI